MNYLSLFSGVEGGGLAFQHLIEPKITENEFNDLFKNTNNVLPCCLFSIKNIRNYLHEFVILKLKVFHELFPKHFSKMAYQKIS